MNHQIVQNAIDCGSSRRRWCRQVHGIRVSTIDDNFEDGLAADGLITRDPNDVLAIRVADCTPVILASRDGSVVAAVHAGWRGVISGIVPFAVAELERVARISPDNVIAAIGPCIGFDAFEVGPEVWSLFETQFGTSVVRHGRMENKATIDLKASIIDQLTHAGVSANCIDMTDRCTFSRREEFFSHRRDHGLTGRMAAFVAPNAATASAS